MTNRDLSQVQGWGCAVILALFAVSFIIGFVLGRAA